MSLVAVAFWDINWPSAHVLHTVHEGRRWVSACWYDPLGQAVHVKPLVVPAHVPVRYWPDAQLTFEQVLHLKPLVVPLHVPL